MHNLDSWNFKDLLLTGKTSVRLALPCVLLARQETDSLDPNSACKVAMVTEPCVSTLVLGRTLPESTKWIMLGGLDSAVHTHFTISASMKQEDQVFSSGASVRTTHVVRSWFYILYKYFSKYSLFFWWYFLDWVPTQHIELHRAWFALSYFINGSTVQVSRAVSGDIWQHEDIAPMHFSTTFIMPHIVAGRRVSITGARQLHSFSLHYLWLMLNPHIHWSVCKETYNSQCQAHVQILRSFTE